MAESDAIKYTVFIKVPFPRGNFEDPPDPNWNSTQDRELWKTLSSTAKGRDIDWEALAQNFDVSIRFLLQQAAWLYEKQLSQVREQLRKVGKNPSGLSPTPGSASGTVATPTGGYAMKRGGSHGSRVPSSLSVRQRASLDFQGEISAPSTPVQGRVPYSRTTSKDTITQTQQGSGAQGTGESPRPHRTSLESRMRETQILSRNRSSTSSPSAAESSSGSSSPDPPITQSRAFARRPNFGSPKGKGKAPLAILSSGDEDEDEEDDSPAFLPYAEPKEKSGQRGDGKNKASQAHGRAPANPSTSSSQSLPSPAPQSSSIPSVSSPTSNPVRPSAMAALSPRQRRLAQDGSEGTPSMGSSFSDLDEASLTQSALEEALAREIRAGKGSLGVVSRMGGLWKGQGPGQGRGSGRPA